MKRMYDLNDSAIEKLKNQALNNGRTITSELNRILNALPDVKKEVETVKKQFHKDYFNIGQTYFDEDQNECKYDKEISIVTGSFYYENEFQSKINHFKNMYIDSNCTKKVIQ